MDFGWIQGVFTHPLIAPMGHEWMAAFVAEYGETRLGIATQTLVESLSHPNNPAISNLGLAHRMMALTAIGALKKTLEKKAP
jgi:hypothetical protein